MKKNVFISFIVTGKMAADTKLKKTKRRPVLIVFSCFLGLLQK
ncbi:MULTISPECIES: hypothetical protein [Providencia]|nr:MULTISPECIES: hypothetical protein [Providencia]MDW7588944.1 hypothetical protein [Providencia sp. 2023EL-00965]WAZ78056.1 hypothetical protein O4001_17855 [Providencia stuartii]